MSTYRLHNQEREFAKKNLVNEIKKLDTVIKDTKDESKKLASYCYNHYILFPSYTIFMRLGCENPDVQR